MWRNEIHPQEKRTLAVALLDKLDRLIGDVGVVVVRLIKNGGVDPEIAVAFGIVGLELFEQLPLVKIVAIRILTGHEFTGCCHDFAGDGMNVLEAE